MFQLCQNQDPTMHVEVPPSGQVRRDHLHLRVRATPSESEAVTTDRDSRVIQTRLRTETQI